MKITVKKLSELHKPAHNIRRHSEKRCSAWAGKPVTAMSWSA